MDSRCHTLVVLAAPALGALLSGCATQAKVGNCTFPWDQPIQTSDPMEQVWNNTRPWDYPVQYADPLQQIANALPQKN
jgi:hypothetical protein